LTNAILWIYSDNVVFLRDFARMFERLKARLLIKDLEEGSIRENSDTVDKLRAIGPDAVDALIHGLKSKKYRVKLECIRALGYIGDPRAIPHLETLGDHHNDVVRQYAHAALERIHGRNAASGAN
jgi:HEAT repeat protein